MEMLRARSNFIGVHRRDRNWARYERQQVPILRRVRQSVSSRGVLRVRSDLGNGAASLSGDESSDSNGFLHEIAESLVNDDFANADQPSPGMNSIAQALQAIKAGKFVIVVDDEDRENEGDLIMAASLVTPEAVAFMVKHCTGIVCVPMKGEDLDRLNLPLMVPDRDNEEALLTAFTITVDAKGTGTGVSSTSRAQTISALASPDTKSVDLRRPGHILPLRYREGGVLKRAGHTEAAVDLAVMAGLPPCGVICEMVEMDDVKGGMARLPFLQKFAKTHNIPLISIADMVRYRRKREKLVERTGRSRIPTDWGEFYAYCYKSKLDGIEHVAMVKGDIGDGQDVLVRVHSECLTGDVFGSERCDCGNQLKLAMMQIEQEGRGVLVYLRGHEGRGIGLGHKLRAYNLQDLGRDTVEANQDLGLPVDSREYGIGAQILRDVGVRTIRLMTNNPAKYMGLRGYGLAITGRIPVLSAVTPENQRYLETKRFKMGHIYGAESFSGMIAKAAQQKQEEKDAAAAAEAADTADEAAAAAAQAAGAAATAQAAAAAASTED